MQITGQIFGYFKQNEVTLFVQYAELQLFLLTSQYHCGIMYSYERVGGIQVKYFIYCLLAFIAFLLFAPGSGSTEIRNPELLIAIATFAAIVLIIRFLKLARLAGHFKNSLKENRFEIKSTRFGFGKVYITAKNREETLDICLLRRKKSYFKYHFIDAEHIELYKTTVSAVRTGRDIAKVSKYSEVKHAGDIRIAPPKNGAKRLIVFDKFPSTVSDTSNRSLQVGDKIVESEVAVFDLNSFKY